MAGKPWYNNGEIERQIGPNEEIPDGFIKGRLPLSNETKYKLHLASLNKSEEQKRLENEKRSNSLKNTFSNKSQEEKEISNKKRKDTWNKKSDDEIQEYKDKLSNSMKGKNLGKKTWNTGLTKETDSRVLNNAEKTSKAVKRKVDFLKQQDPDYFNKWRNSINDVMRQNNSFNKSDSEDKYYLQLVNKYGKDDVIRWYSDERYPFVCDFYIPSEDKFIELNKHWTHGGHLFDELSLEDISKLEYWEEMAKTSKYYKNAIYTWTILDVKKNKIAKENNLNYEVIY